MASTEPNPYAPAPAQPALVDDRRIDPGLLDVPAAPGLAARLGAEALGTFALVLVILGTAMYLRLGAQVGTFGVAIAAGLVLAGLIASLGHISGGHFNPAVTIGAVIDRRTDPKAALPYIGVQLVGAIAAAGLLAVIANGQPGFDLKASGFAGLNDALAPGGGLIGGINDGPEGCAQRCPGAEQTRGFLSLSLRHSDGCQSLQAPGAAALVADLPADFQTLS